MQIVERGPERRVIVKTSPITGEVLGEFPVATREEVEAAVARAREAFPRWRAIPIEERIAILSRMKEILRAKRDEFARRISEDTGKPLVDSIMTELLVVPAFLDHYAKRAPKVLARKRVPASPLFPGKIAYIEYFPMGVIAVISPWNFPFQLAVVPALSALIAGNTVVIKPSEVTPITGELIRELFQAIGLERGVVEVVLGDGSTGAFLTEAKVDKIFFTGSVATGRRVMAAAAKHPIPVELELGGKDAMIVCADAPLERAARGAAWGGLLNCGQMCTSVERIFVEAPVYERFLELLLEEVKKVKVGGPDEGADMGPITFPKQLETVERHVRDALEKGAKLLFGGHRIDRPGQFYAPTLLSDVRPDMAVYTEESFGPILPVIRVRDVEEAIQLANQHEYGLNASVWTRDLQKGFAIASRLECGQVTINDVVSSVAHPGLPFGGVKSSGFGRYHGDEGLLSFVHTRALLADRGWLKTEPFWFPYRRKYEALRDAFDAMTQGKVLNTLYHFIRMMQSG
ncbi:MAG: aldehyde dehydrogenase family protein [Deltaproteobacteria bacterium]|nr:aldehyde dehydrogenase family protein [Sandaracinaceae bacterium]MCX7808184.1 aldehyde dehydrogenase family protein [Deltaproteobacteria bacterium]MDW8244951.1 aldehyde dehydrogenase family protein [Sandaracinaceae bacterium]